jgi:hypothetical protein
MKIANSAWHVIAALKLRAMISMSSKKFTFFFEKLKQAEPYQKT